MTNKLDSQRFAAKVEVSDTGCWLWTSSKCDGYGTFSVRNRPVKAHRWSYSYFVGPITGGLVIDHLCRNRDCVNPAHLEPVTNRENTRRSPIHAGEVNKRKTHCINGHPYDSLNTYVGTYKGKQRRRCNACHTIAEQKRRAQNAKTLKG